MQGTRNILDQFSIWAAKTPSIRAAILTSSRVVPESVVDPLSDYDIELYVSDLKPFQMNDDWLQAFGSIMARWPLTPSSTLHKEWITRLVLFSDGVRIDFQITDQTSIANDTYDDGYRVLVDKDGLTKHLPPPSYSGLSVKKPSQLDYETCVNDFWWDSTYVAKYLWRDELYIAKNMLDNIIRFEYLQKMIEWYIGVEQNWSVNTGWCGRRFKRYLEPTLWNELESTYAGPNIADNWNAFFCTVDLFRKLAKNVGAALNYPYPDSTDRDITGYNRQIQSLPRPEQKDRNL